MTERKRQRRRTGPGPFAVSIGIGFSSLTAAHANPDRDPSRALEVTIGAREDLAPVAGISPERDFQTHLALPSELHVLWQRRLPGRLASAPAIDAEGRAVVGLDSGRVLQLDREGRTEWSVAVGESAVLAGPVIARNGDRWLLTRSLEIWRLRDDGKQLSHRAAPLGPFRAPASPLSLDNGTVFFALGRTLLCFDDQGSLIAQSRAPSEILEILAQHGRVYVAQHDGVILRWTANARLVPLGAFPAAIARGPFITEAGRFVASLVNDTIVELNPNTPKNERWRVLGNEELLAGPVLRGRAVLGVTTSGSLWQTESSGEGLGAAVADPLNAAPGAATVLLTDREGRVLLARAGSGVAGLDPRGAPGTLPAATCPTPLALLPAGRGRVLLACSSGTVWMLGATPPARG